MTLYAIPNASAISEFVAGFTGDCGETAELCALHVYDPVRFPLDANQLSIVVHRDISQGWASSNGSEPIGAIDKDLSFLNVAHSNYGYSEPPTFDWRGMLKNAGGLQPIIFEYANAQALPGDEQGVQYHFNTCMAWDDAAGYGLFADGDNAIERQGGNGLVRYTVQDLMNARICGMLVLAKVVGGNTTMVPNGWTDDGTTLTAPNGLKVVSGFRLAVLGWPNGWEAANWPVENENDSANPVELGNTPLGNGARQCFRWRVLGWTPTRNVYEIWNGQELHAVYALYASSQNNLVSAQAEIANLKSQIATTVVPTQQETDALAALTSLKKVLGEI